MQLYNECPILTQEYYEDTGKYGTYRPDRVMFGKDEIIVVDFKFGRPRDEYRDQVGSYMKQLRLMEPDRRVKGSCGIFSTTGSKKFKPNLPAFMETFIRLIAKDLISRFGTNLRDVTVVFPNKRAGLFMNQQLAAVSGRPVWAPRYRTISELFDSLSDFTRCDEILSVCELHRAYAALVPTLNRSTAFTAGAKSCCPTSTTSTASGRSS